MSHTIPLRGHWTTEEVEPGRVRHSRRFGQPRAFDPRETVWLVASSTPGAGSVMLNGELLGMVLPDQPWEFEVTQRLLPRNLLCIDLRVPVTHLPGEVAVEIRPPVE